MSRYDPSPYLEPGRAAVIVFECQEMVIGPHGPYPGLVASAAVMLPTLAGLLQSARRAGVPVVYANFVPRPTGPTMARAPHTDAAGGSARVGGAPDTRVVDVVRPEAGDVIVERAHGMSAFHGTELDSVLRGYGVDTVVVTGVSANLGVLGTVIEAYNHGYRAVVPSDCVAGDPPDYGAAMMRYSFRNLAYVTAAATVRQVWER